MKAADYITPIDQINKVNEEELLAKLKEIDLKNKKFRRSFIHANDAKLRCSR